MSKTARPTDTFGKDGKVQLQDQFDAMVYRSITQKVGLSAEYQKSSVSVAGDGEEGAGSVTAESQQLKFDFFSETRVEELAFFQQRTDAVAEGVEGAQKNSFVAASQQVSARFSFSLEISGAALSGYAGAAEGLQGTEDGFEAFMGLVNDTLSETDAVLNQVFELLNDFFSGKGDLESRFMKFMEGLGQLDFSELANAFGGDMGAGAQASGQTAQVQSFSVSIQMEFEFQYESQEVVQQGDPLAFDLDGDGIELTSYRQGAQFDLMGTGENVTTAFVTGGDAFLALDRNGNGAIDSGKELFGEQDGSVNGFEELRKLDSNGDGRINALDKEFDSLRLWKDDGNGKTEEGEVVTLAQAGVEEIDLSYRNVDQHAMGGNRITQIASFLRNDGTSGKTADALLNFIA